MTTMKWPLIAKAAREVEQTLGTPECRNFRRKIFARFPLVADDLVCGAVAVATAHGRGSMGNAKANTWLRIMQKQLTLGPFNVTHDDQALDDYARAKAEAMAASLSYRNRTVDASYAATRRKHFWRMPAPSGIHYSTLSFHRYVWPSRRIAELDVIREGLKEARRHRLNLATVAKPEQLSASQRYILLNKLLAASWWRRKLRTQASRRLDQFMRMVKRVHKRAGIYVSDLVFNHWQQRQAANQAMLEEMLAVNQFDQEYTLAELSAKGVGNRDIRFMETMMRIRETEAYASHNGHRAVFVTWTLPSAWHAVLQNSGEPNPKYNGSTPRAAHAQLQKLWAQARAKLKRDGISYYGVRTAEPHHDGCPHWHMMLWVAEDQLDALLATIEHYALSIDPEEVRGKKRVRIRFEHIDPDKGSAAGYVIKYVAKNINCTQRPGEIDKYGRPMESSAPRIAAWASVHGIRQFQFFGLPSVTVWRELRRLRDHEDDPFAASCFEDWVALTKPDPEAMAILHDLRRAAHSSRWDKFIELCGGPCVPLNDRPVRPWRMKWLDPKAERINRQTGEIRVNLEKLGVYGEPVESIIGVTVTSQTGEAFFMSRVYRWEVKPAGFGGQRSGEAAEPWRALNNCTGPDIQPREPNPQEAFEQQERLEAWRASAGYQAELEDVERYEHQMREKMHQKFARVPEWQGVTEYFPPELLSLEDLYQAPTRPGRATQNPVTSESRFLWKLLTSSSKAPQRQKLGIDDEQALRLAATFFEPPTDQKQRATWSDLLLRINRERIQSPRGGQMRADEALMIAAALWEAPAPVEPMPTPHS